ncbi:MAG TPA: AAA family ATPase [Bacillota bacterium]|nr:AAA family ATPase [Bacillota bacterium]
MKPLKLSIEGLHSFKERQEIDFVQLGETGLFGIFGNTGSGKSTVLDAITLALYGAVVRAASRTQGVLNSQRDKLEVVFTFTIGTGDQRKVYRVERGFKRHKEKRDSVQTTVCRLVDMTGGADKIIAESMTDVTRKIEEIVGLNMEDFTRSVVLPQGEFSKFLQLKDAERVRMLERIFALADYGSKLNEKVKKERDSLALQVGLVERSIQEQGEVSETQLTALRTEIMQKEQEQQQLLADAGKIDSDFAAVNQIWLLQCELDQLQQQQALHLQNRNEVELKRAIWDKAQLAETLQPYLEGSKTARVNLGLSQKELQNIWALFQTEQAENQRLREEFLKVEQLYFEKQPELIAKRTEVQALLTLETELEAKESELAKLHAEQSKLTEAQTQLQTRIETGELERSSKETKRSQIEAEIQALTVDAAYKEQVLAGVEAEKEVDRLETEIDRFEAEKAEQVREQQELEAEIKQQEAEVTRLTQEMEELQNQSLRQQQQKPGDFQSYARRNSELSRLESEINQIITAHAETEAAKFEVLKLMEAWNPAKENQVKLYKAIDQKQQRLAHMEEVQVKVNAEIRLLEEQSLVARMAAELHNGVPCPVCGANQHPKKAEFDHSLLEKAKVKMENNEAVLQTIRQELEQLNREFYQGQAQTEQYQNRYTELQEKVTVLWDKLAGYKQELPAEIREKGPSDLKNYLKQHQSEIENYQQTISQWEEATQRMQQELGKAKEAKMAAGHQVQQLGHRMELLGQSLQKLAERLQTVQQDLKQKQDALEQLRTKLNFTGFQDEQKRILANERKLEVLRQTSVRATVELTELAATLSKLRTENEQLNLKIQELKTHTEVLTREVAERQARIQAVTGERKPGELLAAINDYLEKLVQKYEYLKERAETSRVELQGLESRVAEARKKLELSQETVDRTAEELNRQLLERGFLNESDLQDALRNQQERAQLKARIDEFDDLCKRFQHQLETVQQKLDGRAVTLEQWEQLRQQQEDQQVRKEQLVAELAKLGTQLADVEKRYQKVRQYLKEKRSLESKKAMVDEIVKLLQGDAFVAYIAEEHMRYILRDASRRLEMLTGGRYALRLDENKDFVVADNTNGGIVRPVSSLSGGETFLVSFALALALSGKIQLNGKNPLEFFFLDEGFGTLDPQLLEVVMDSLERLRQEKLTIGVISHMPEMRNRISRRLIVTAASPDGSGSRVRIEKA